jgi:DNA mismatch repair protein MSH4
MKVSVAVCEKLLETKAFTFFVTHFMELPTAFSQKAHVVSLQLQVTLSNANDLSGEMKYQYSVKSGVCQTEHYGIRLATQMAFPTSLIEFSLQISNDVLNPDSARRAT